MHEDFAVAVGDGTLLAGTLTRPDAHVRAPAALLLNGSGPLDRDSNMPGQTLNVASALAAALAAEGVASLRYDKRGVGRSGGDYLRTGFDEETGDALAALAALRRIPGVDAASVTVIGHSAGATIAIRLASASDGLAGVVLLCAACRIGAEVMRQQSERIAASLAGPAWLRPRRFLRRQERDRRLLLESAGDTIELAGEAVPARWFREFMAYDPARDLAAIRCPIMAITGGGDLQVDPEDVDRIGAIVRAPFTPVKPEGLSHVLRKHAGPPSLATYPAQLKQPVDADLLAQVARRARHGPPAE